MRVLIGTPIHEVKDYGMERWLESVAKLEYPYDLFLVDNSNGTAYGEKVKGYCEKYGLKNYEVKHIEIEPQYGADERINKSREVIREKVLKEGYDAWCTLECDTIVPPEGLTQLVELIGDFWMVNHVYPNRDNSNDVNVDFGFSLVKKIALIDHGFLLQFGYIDPLMPNCWHGGERWFMRRVVRSGGKYIDVYGVIQGIQHLNE